MTKRVACVAMLFLVCLPLHLAAQEIPLLFHDARPSVRAQGNARGQEKRSRAVQPDFEALKIPAIARGQRAHIERLTMANLFDDVRLPLALNTVEHDLAGSIVWTGTVLGDPGSNVAIAVNHEMMSASFWVRDHRYAIRPTADGGHEAIELDGTAFPDEQAPLRTSAPGRAVAQSAAVTMADSGSTWDILVAYTNIMRTHYGTAAAVVTLISNAVAATNTAYANSAVTPRLRLVGTLEVNYDDQTATFGDTLGRLQSTNDGYMDEVHAQRNSLGADDVSLIVWKPLDSGCGVGYLMQAPPSAGFAPYAFNVVGENCAVGNLSFAHELGHNFGLAHDRANAGPNPNPSYPYAFGYQDTSSLFRDIMSYNCPVQGGCPRIQYFSNPDVLYNGRPTGVNYLSNTAADNARALNNSASVIANWRPQATIPNVVFTDDPLIAGTTVVKAVHLAELRDAINSVRAQAAMAAATWTDSSLAGVRIKAVHITEMRNALTPALTALGRPPAYTDSSLATGMLVRAVHVQELRNYTK